MVAFGSATITAHVTNPGTLTTVSLAETGGGFDTPTGGFAKTIDVTLGTGGTAVATASARPRWRDAR